MWDEQKKKTANFLIDELHQSGEFSYKVGERTYSKNELIHELETFSETGLDLVKDYLNGSNIFFNHG